MALHFAVLGFCLSVVRVAQPTVSPADLVRRLGDASFADRELATAQIRRLGRVAVPALTRGLTNEDAEIRRRCQELLPIASRSDLDIQLDAFIDGTAPPAPLAGWERFRKLAGDDILTREVFVELYRRDRDLLATLDKDEGKAGSMLGQRCSRWQHELNRRGDPQQLPVHADVVGILYLAALNTSGTQPFYQFYNTLHLPGVGSQVRSCRVCCRLITEVVKRKTDSLNNLQHVVYLVRHLRLPELEETTIKPAVARLCESTAQKPEEYNQLYQLIYLAQDLQMKDVLDRQLKPALRKSAVDAVKKPDPNRLSQIGTLAINLGMTDLVDSTIKPAALKYIEERLHPPVVQGPPERPERPDRRGRRRDPDAPFTRLQEVFNLARNLEMTDVLEQKLKPAAYLYIESKLRDSTNLASLQEVYNLTEWFDLQEAFDDLVRPAATRFIADKCSRPGDTGFREAITLAQQLSLTEVSREYFRPALRKVAQEAAAKPEDLARLYQVFQDLRSLELKDVILEVLKPAVRKVVQQAADHPLQPSMVAKVLDMARMMSLTEATDFAVRAALAKDVALHSRTHAVLFVADFGGKDKTSLLEPLLADKGGDLGNVGVNSTSLKTEFRDVVLAALITAHKQHPADFGFLYPSLSGAPLSVETYAFFGFPDDKTRSESLTKWKKWVADQGK
jgi:hypothetical protein